MMDSDLILALKLQREFELEDQQNNQNAAQVNIFNLKKKQLRQSPRIINNFLAYLPNFYIF